MTRHVLDNQSAGSDAFQREALRIKQDEQPNTASLKLQRRPLKTSAKKRAAEFVAIEKGRRS